MHPIQHPPVHRFHIPVMGTGFTIATPLSVARYGISSVVSIVDDMLIEQTRQRVARRFGKAAVPIGRREDDHRARRITAYLDLLDEIVHEQVEALRTSAFQAGSEIVRYFEMLPDSPPRQLYEAMQRMAEGPAKEAAQEDLRDRVRPGSIDVNIMTKVDRDPSTGRIGSGSPASEAMAALRGFARSRLRSSVVLSAGLNLRLFSYLAEFGDFFPDEAGRRRKGIVLKVEDLRSAAIQGKVLAKRGLWVSEFRIESGLNCGGHAFGERGRVLGPILEEFQEGREELLARLHEITDRALAAAGRPVFGERPPCRLTVQGGIGTAEENEMLHRVYGVDGTGWGSPFLFVPEVVSIDADHLQRLVEAGEGDVELSRTSPLGVPFWSLRNSASERERKERIAAGKPGSACPKGFLISNTEFHGKGLCTASSTFQRRKLDEIGRDLALTPLQRRDAEADVVAKACLCRNLGGGAEPSDERGVAVPTAVCCGPNAPYFSAVATLKQMVDHIYGRFHLPLAPHRPHVFLKEMRLHVSRLEEQLQRGRDGLTQIRPEALQEARENLTEAVEHYRLRAVEIAGARVNSFRAKLEQIHDDVQILGREPAVEA
jgi:hypothetical protein